MTENTKERIEIVSQEWRGKYDMYCLVRIGDIEEWVAVEAMPPWKEPEVYFGESSELSPEMQSEIGGILLGRYWGIDEDE